MRQACEPLIRRSLCFQSNSQQYCVGRKNPQSNPLRLISFSISHCGCDQFFSVGAFTPYVHVSSLAAKNCADQMSAERRRNESNVIFFQKN